jgi:hypothetical protein
MRGPIRWPAISLDLDDPAHAWRTIRDLANQAGSEEGRGGDGGMAEEDLARKCASAVLRPAQRGKTAVTSSGMIPPKKKRKAGTS